MKNVDIISSNSSIKFEQASAQQSPKKKKCIKLVLIILAIVIVIAVVFILVAKYKYNFFKKEIYQVAEIKRDLGTTEYFTEKKTMASKMLYSNGQSQETEQVIDSKFVVMITERLHLENNDYLNTAALIILESKVQMEGKEAELDSLNIFDEEVMKKFETSEENTKYPTAIFHFYENGTLKDIKLPINSSKDEIQTMVDLINEVIPKLIRNKTEDDKKGIQITSKGDKKIKSFKEYEPQKEFVNKYTNSSIKGSKITKAVERNVENKKLTKVISNTSLYMETQKKEEDTYLNLGIDNLYFNVSSKILPYEMKENKNDKDLIKKVISKQSYVDGEELLNAISEKEKEEKEKNTEKENQLRNLALSSSQFVNEWTILNFDILGVDIKLVYNTSLNGGKFKNYFKFTSGSTVITLGNTEGKNTSVNETLNSKDIELAKISLLSLVTLSFKISYEIKYGLIVEKNFDFYDSTISGVVSAKSGIDFGIGNIARIDAGVKGNILSADFTTKIQKNNNGKYAKKYIMMKANSGQFGIYAIGYVLWWKVLDVQLTLWNGWSKTWTW